MAQKGKNKQCAAICRDVIAQLNARKYIPIVRHYINSDGGRGHSDNPFGAGDLQKQLKKRTKPCGVCAIGSMFLSRVKIYDEYSITSYKDWYTGEVKTNPIYSDDMLENLEKFFTATELAYIEATYESMSRFMLNVSGGIKAEKAFKVSPLKKLKRLIPNNGERMRWIMRHIIRNKGNFNVKNAEKAAKRLIK